MPTTTPPPQQPPVSPWAMNPARITLLVLGVLALLMIAGGIFGGLSNYEALSDAASSSSSSVEAASAN